MHTGVEMGWFVKNVYADLLISISKATSHHLNYKVELLSLSLYLPQ